MPEDNKIFETQKKLNEYLYEQNSQVVKVNLNIYKCKSDVNGKPLRKMSKSDLKEW